MLKYCESFTGWLLGAMFNSAIHKAAVHRSAGSWNDLRDPFQPLVPLMASGMEWWNDGIVPGKIMGRPATMNNAASIPTV